MTQYSIRSKRSAIRAHAVYFLHSTMPSVTCLLSDVSVICRVTYFQFPIQSAFLPYIGSVGIVAYYIGFDTQYRTSDVAENLGRYLLCAERTFHGKDFELILTVKWKLDIPYRVSFVVNFRRSVIIAELWRPEVARPANFANSFFACFKNDPYGKIFKILFWMFHCLTDRRCCVEISWNLSNGKSEKSCVIYLTNRKTKFRLHVKLSLLCGSRQNSASASPQQCAHSAPDYIQIDSLTAELLPKVWTPVLPPWVFP